MFRKSSPKEKKTSTLRYRKLEYVKFFHRLIPHVQLEAKRFECGKASKKVGHSPQQNVERILESTEVPFLGGKTPQIHRSCFHRARNYKTLSYSRTLPVHEDQQRVRES